MRTLWYPESKDFPLTSAQLMENILNIMNTHEPFIEKIRNVKSLLNGYTRKDAMQE